MINIIYKLLKLNNQILRLEKHTNALLVIYESDYKNSKGLVENNRIVVMSDKEDDSL